MEAEWFLCSTCMLALKETLKLEDIVEKPVQDNCRMCGRKVWGSRYKVSYKTKGDKRD